MSKSTRSRAGAPAEAGRRSWSLPLLVLALLLLGVWLLIIVPQWLAAGRALQEIPFSLHAVKAADYSLEFKETKLPGVSLAILKDVLQDLEPEDQDIEARVDAVIVQMKTSVPSATFTGDQPEDIDPTAVQPTLAETPQPTIGQPTVAQTTIVPTEITPPTLAPPTATMVLFTSTSTRRVEPTSPPTTAERTSTPTSAHTATQTPTSTHTPTFTPTFTHTPTPTSTHTPTPTFTATPDGCSIPDHTTGFVQSMTPADGSGDQNFAIQPLILFNQAMDSATLTYGDDRHILLEQCAALDCASTVLVPASVSVSTSTYSDDQVTVIPDAALLPDTIYRLGAGVQVSNSPICGSRNQAVRVYSTFTTSP